MPSNAKRHVTNIEVKAIEKRYKPTRCYKFVLEVMWSDKSRYVIYRSYSEFFQIHMELIEAFPLEAGEIDEKDCVLPKLTSSSLFSRSEVQKVAEKRQFIIVDYCKRLMQLEPKISQYYKLLQFFEPTQEDLDGSGHCGTPKSKKSGLKKLFSKNRKKKKSTSSMDLGDDMEITGPMQPEQYVTIADFKAAGRGQISFSKDEIVDVLDKNPNGWWYVTTPGQEGWAPATYLDKISQPAGTGDKDEIQCLAGELFLSVKAYTAAFEDELTFGEAVVLEVMNKVLDGWWIASYDEKIGYVPSTYLKPYNNPYLNSINPNTLPPPPTGQRSPVLAPAPRRQSIRSDDPPALPTRDLQPYRMASQKRRQRSIRHQQRSIKESRNKAVKVTAGITAQMSLIVESDGDEEDEGYLTPAFLESASSPRSSASEEYLEPSSLFSKPPFRERNLKVMIPMPDPSSLARSPLVQRHLSPSPGSPKGSPRQGSPPVASRSTPPPTPTANSPTMKCRTVPLPPPPSPRQYQTGSDDYEPIHDYDQPPNPEPDSTAKSSKSSSNSPNTGLSLPDAVRRSKSPGRDRGKLNSKVPPPKPTGTLTRLSKTDDGDYEYDPVSIAPPPPPAAPTKPSRTLPPPPSIPKASPRMDKTKTLPSYLSSGNTEAEEQRNLFTKLKPVANSPVLSAKLAHSPKYKPGPPLKSPKPHPQKASSEHEISQPKEQFPHSYSSNELVLADNNNTGDGKIYEEFLIKPSQMKGMNNAQLRNKK